MNPTVSITGTADGRRGAAAHQRIERREQPILDRRSRRRSEGFSTVDLPAFVYDSGAAPPEAGPAFLGRSSRPSRSAPGRLEAGDFRRTIPSINLELRFTDSALPDAAVLPPRCPH